MIQSRILYNYKRYTCNCNPTRRRERENKKRRKGREEEAKKEEVKKKKKCVRMVKIPKLVAD